MFDSQAIPPNAIDTTKSGLLRDLKSGDPLAWQELFFLYSKVVRYWVVRAGVKASADREDIVQSVFVTVSKYIDKFERAEGRAKFRSWLKALTSTKVADFFRGRQKHDEAVGGSVAAELIAQVPEVDGDIEPLTPTEESMLVQRAIGMIKGEFREKTWQSFQRTAIDGLNATSVAEELNATSAAVRKNKARVLRRLREILEDAGLAGCFDGQ